TANGDNATVTGAPQNFSVGIGGTGRLSLAAGTLNVGDVKVGDQDGSKGTVSVFGNAVLHATSMEVGNVQSNAGPGGTGTLSISDSARVTVSGDLTLLDVGTIDDDFNETLKGVISIHAGSSLEIGGNAGAAANTLKIDLFHTLSGHGEIDSEVTGGV